MKAIIVVDAQNDFITGTLANPDAQDALPILHEVVEWGVINGYDLFYTKDTHYDNYIDTQEGKFLPVPHCIYKTPGNAIAAEALPEDPSYLYNIIEKETFGYTGWENFDFSDCDEIIICGFCTDICVMANAQFLKAFNPEIPMTIISDACAGVTPVRHEAALDVFRSTQFNVTTWEDYDYEWFKKQ